MPTEHEGRTHNIRSRTIRENYESLEVWTILEAADYAYVGEATISKWIREKKFPVRPAGPGARVYAAPFKRFLDTKEPQQLESLMQSTT